MWKEMKRKVFLSYAKRKTNVKYPFYIFIKERNVYFWSFEDYLNLKFDYNTKINTK